MKRKITEIFSMSFLDIMSCGFGAIVLILLISQFKTSEVIDEVMPKVSLIELEKSLETLKNKNLFITETKDSFLTQLANKLKAEIIEHKNFIGGRYSVLSEVGMLPAELMGLKEKRFKNFNNLIKNKNFSNLLINNVVAINQLILKKKNPSLFVSIFGLPKIKIHHAYIEMVNILYFNKK